MDSTKKLVLLLLLYFSLSSFNIQALVVRALCVGSYCSSYNSMQ